MTLDVLMGSKMLMSGQVFGLSLIDYHSQHPLISVIVVFK